MANSKKSISSRIDSDIYNKLVKVSKVSGHKYYDRKVAYIVNKVLEDWSNKEK
jgi:hypothetical protein|tara:strand:- start:724 stop:882 length:159 start_codon:yes stop_codon:yes gene_type:complete